ncbi:GSCOCG00011715001-RA-CDS [Cotesia congregata]|nr:GSCOCG00011715001-RA-CDS [Cotesia congregata]
MRLTSGSMGPDHFEIKTYKVLLSYFLSHITNLFNFSLSSGSFPSAWKKSYVLPLPKVRSPASYADYRPISLLCTLSKALE